MYLLRHFGHWIKLIGRCDSTLRVGKRTEASVDSGFHFSSLWSNHIFEILWLLGQNRLHSIRICIGVKFKSFFCNSKVQEILYQSDSAKKCIYFKILIDIKRWLIVGEEFAIQCCLNSKEKKDIYFSGNRWDRGG